MGQVRASSGRWHVQSRGQAQERVLKDLQHRRERQTASYTLLSGSLGATRARASRWGANLDPSYRLVLHRAVTPSATARRTQKKTCSSEDALLLQDQLFVHLLIKKHLKGGLVSRKRAKTVNQWSQRSRATSNPSQGTWTGSEKPMRARSKTTP